MEPLDLDDNGLFDWLSVRFELPVKKPGSYTFYGYVEIPTPAGRRGDNVFPLGWSLNRASAPFVDLQCDSMECPAELWISGRELTRASTDSVLTVYLDFGERYHPFASYARVTIELKRNDWWRFQAGY